MNKEATTDSQIHELLSSRWSPRAFSSRSIEPENISSLLEAARWAPSCFNEQPWSLSLRQMTILKNMNAC